MDKTSVVELTPIQTRAVQVAFATYLDVYEREKGRLPNSIDVHHSALLPWLLAGNEPLPQPPPKLYSRPCHELETGRPVGIWDKPWEHNMGAPGGPLEGTAWAECNFCIGQDISWKSLDKNHVQHVPTGHVYLMEYPDMAATGHAITLTRVTDTGPIKHVDCGCWATDCFRWTEGCSEHPYEL